MKKRIHIVSLMSLLVLIISNILYAQNISTEKHSAASFTQIFFVDSVTGWVAGYDGLIRKTTTGGSTWTEQSISTTNNFNALFFIDKNTGWVCGDNGTIQKTTNGGATWTPQNSGGEKVLFWITFVDPNHGWVASAQDSGVILSTTNGGTNWTFQNSNAHTVLTMIKFVNQNYGWAVGSDGVIVRTTNGGNTWSKQITNTTVPLWGVDFIDTLHGWAAGGDYNVNSSVLLKTSDGGSTWQTINFTVGWPFFKIEFIDTARGWLCGRGGTIYKTTNGGESWIDKSYGGLWFGSLSPLNDKFVWVSEGGGTLMKTTNGGTSWTVDNMNNLNALLTFSILSVVDVPNDQGKQVSVIWRTPPAATEIFSISEFNIWRKDETVWTHVWEVPYRPDSILSVVVPTLGDSTISQGMFTSTFQVTAHGSNPLQILYTNPADGYSVDNLKPLSPTGLTLSVDGTNLVIGWNPSEDEDFHHYSIYRSTTSNFNPKGTVPYKMTGDSKFVDEGVSTNAQTFYYRISAVDLSYNESEYSSEISSKLTSVEMQAESPKVFSLSQNYPNPFNPSTTINYQLPKNGFVRLTIFDVLGRIIDKLVDARQPAGYYTTTWNSKNISSGLYIYQIAVTTDDGIPFVDNKKMTMMK